LPLFVFLISFADYINCASPLNELAIFAYFFY